MEELVRMAIASFQGVWKMSPSSQAAVGLRKSREERVALVTGQERIFSNMNLGSRG